MATAQVPSFLQWNLPLDNVYIKQEKYQTTQMQEEETFKWLNVDHLPSMNSPSSSSSSSYSMSNATFFSPQAQPQSPPSPQQGNYQSYQQPGVFNYTTGMVQPSVQISSSQAQTGFTAIQLPQFVNQMGGQQTYNGPIAFQAITPQGSVPIQNQILLPNFGYPQQAQQQITISPQLFNQLMSQAPLKVINPTAEDAEDRKRKKDSRVHQRPKRQTRPKVVEAKGAVQCKGKNRKKGTQCRNAALMEYIGPRPIYCAEHIELDPNTLYEKCKSPYQKEVGDKKGCKEVVLKEFGLCYKHYPDMIAEMLQNNDYDSARRHYDRICELLAQLERDAAAAKKKDGDLYQRKNKLIPKFQEMRKLITRAVEELRPKGLIDHITFSPSELNAPMLNLSSDDDDFSPLTDDLDGSLDSRASADTSPFSDIESAEFESAEFDPLSC